MTEPDQSHQAPLVQGDLPSSLDRFWLDTARNMTKESVGALEEAAKQLITITTFSQSIYFAAISLSDLKKSLGQLPFAQQWLFVVLLTIPLLLWIISLIIAIRVFRPKTYQTNLESPDFARETYQEVVAYKHKQLQHAYVILALGFIPLTVNVIWYLLYAPLAPIK